MGGNEAQCPLHAEGGTQSHGGEADGAQNVENAHRVKEKEAQHEPALGAGGKRVRSYNDFQKKIILGRTRKGKGFRATMMLAA